MVVGWMITTLDPVFHLPHILPNLVAQVKPYGREKGPQNFRGAGHTPLMMGACLIPKTALSNMCFGTEFSRSKSYRLGVNSLGSNIFSTLQGARKITPPSMYVDL